jgi:hypothetical protein
MPPDQFDTIISGIKTGRPAWGDGLPYPVLRFAAGAVLWLLAANLLYVLTWFLLHG